MTSAAKDPGPADDAVRAATGRDWAAWHMLLDGEGAANLAHNALVPLVARQGAHRWWSQIVTLR